MKTKNRWVDKRCYEIKKRISVYRHTCQVCQCFFENDSSDSNIRADKRLCPECGTTGCIITEKIQNIE